eukprot:jgi/Undpi1/8634/HiC_scaffold_25.g11099.m1
MAGVGMARLGKELKMLTEEPPPGVCAWPVDDCITHIQAQIQGPEDTPYERGTFLVDLQIPERYPFEPPKARFVTPIYHPNIDSEGRICLDTLKMRPTGSWAPSMNVPTLLTTIRLLMAHPNGDDGLMPDITELFLKNPSRFADVARAHVEQHARQDSSSGAMSKGAASGRGSSPPRTTNDQKVSDKRHASSSGMRPSAPVANKNEMAWRKGICPPIVGSTRLRHSLVITRTQLLPLLLSVQATDTSVEAACAPAVDDDKPERCLASEGVRQPATDPEKTPPSGAVATEQPDLRVAEVVAKETGKVVDKRSDSDVPKYETAKHQDAGGEGGRSGKVSSSSSSDRGEDGAGGDASSDDGKWSDSDEDDAEGRPDGIDAKRARTAI